MKENCSKDPTIKLFGMKIPLAAAESDPPPVSEPEIRPPEEKAENKDFSAKEATEITEEQERQEDTEIQVTKESEDPETSTESSVKPNTPPVNEESSKSKTSKTEKDENSEVNTEEKTLKKPDKILPCPRCNSMDTKFCYYNNYNINQPRHFCKACQRYWTAGGTMRNVPVGAGRRKSKNSASHYRHITISEALQAARIESPNGNPNPALKSNGRVLSFGVESPVCESMASVNGIRNGFHRIKENKTRENGYGDDCSSGSSVTVSNSNEEHGNYIQNGLIPCLPGVPWPYQLPPPGFPVQFYPPIWNYGGWNIPILSPQSSTNQKAPTLGKHSRNGETVKPYESSVLVPKTLRIDDPNEAAKSSIWTTLGIKNESLNGGKMFKAFQSKTKDKAQIAEDSPVLMANPAALSRSMNFRESS